MAGASYDRYNAFAALPQIENDMKETQEMSSCPFPVTSVLLFKKNDSDPNSIFRGTVWESDTQISGLYAWVRKK